MRFLLFHFWGQIFYFFLIGSSFRTKFFEFGVHGLYAGCDLIHVRRPKELFYLLGQLMRSVR